MTATGSMTARDASQPAAAAKLDAACGQAMELQLAGQLEAAGQLYGAILQAAPRHDAANYGLGMLHVQSQRPAESLPFLMAALETKPEKQDYWLGMLEALLLAGQLADARSTLSLGRQHGLAGAAVEEFARRLATPSAPLPAAAATPAATLALAPASTSTPPSSSPRAIPRNKKPTVREAESALLKLVANREFAEAVTLARSLTRRVPNRATGWKILGAFLPTSDSYDDAIAALRTAVRLSPNDVEARVNLGLILAKAKQVAEAESQLLEALKLDPKFAAAHYRLAIAYEFQGRFAEAEASLRRGIELTTRHIAGDDELSHSHLLFLMSHNPSVSADELFAEHCRFGDCFEGPLRGSWPVHTNGRAAERCLKVGFVSGDLCNHAIASFIEPILAQLNTNPQLELHAYYTHSKQDDVSNRLLRYFKSWNIVCSISDAELAGVITKDAIDILIDLSGHTAFNRLPAFARKPAPLQVAWMGYPGTTGLRAMDYYLADPHFLPPGVFDRHFTEKLVYLPTAPFQPQESAPPVNPLPALGNGYVTFGSFNRLGKINPVSIALWSQLLRESPRSRMLLGGLEPGIERETLKNQFAACGIAADRLSFHDRCGVLSYLELYHQVDICLDTLPYNGGTTTIHALLMGVPTVTLAGATPAGRQGAAILGQMGLHEFIAADAAEFVARGLHWATHLSELAQLRDELRERWTKAADRKPDLITSALDRSLRHMWRRWCAGLPAASFDVTQPDFAAREESIP